MAKPIRSMIREKDLDRAIGFYRAAFDLDVAATHQKLTSLGLASTAIKELETDGATPARFGFVQGPDGYKIQILARLGSYR